MKKATFLLFALFSISALVAQPIADASYTDCNSSTESIYGVLGSGKVLVVANSGTNCSICMSHASGIAGVADNNPNTIRVWGAITTKNGGAVNCNGIANWVSNYNWTNVFSFSDSNKDWFNIATPQYTVISPFDSTIAYQGPNWNTAKSTAENLANSIGINESVLVNNISLRANQLTVAFANTVNQAEINVYSITGATVFNHQVNTAVREVELGLNGTLAPGIYVVRVTVAGRETVQKILL